MFTNVKIDKRIIFATTTKKSTCDFRPRDCKWRVDALRRSYSPSDASVDDAAVAVLAASSQSSPSTITWSYLMSVSEKWVV